MEPALEHLLGHDGDDLVVHVDELDAQLLERVAQPRHAHEQQRLAREEDEGAVSGAHTLQLVVLDGHEGDQRRHHPEQRQVLVLTAVPRVDRLARGADQQQVCSFKCLGIKQPGFPDQADHNLTILWHHRNHTNFLTMILP